MQDIRACPGDLLSFTTTFATKRFMLVIGLVRIDEDEYVYGLDTQRNKIFMFKRSSINVVFPVEFIASGNLELPS